MTCALAVLALAVALGALAAAAALYCLWIGALTARAFADPPGSED
jgi:hypothetical protein